MDGFCKSLEMVERDERLFFVDICVATDLAIPNDRGDSTSGQSVSIAVCSPGVRKVHA